MPVNQFGNSQFPLVLGAVNDGSVTRNVTQTFLAQTVELAQVFRPAADRIFFFGAYPGPLGGPSGEIGQLATHNYVTADVSQTFLADGAGYNQTVDVHQYMGFSDRRFADPPRQYLFKRFNIPASSQAHLVIGEDADNEFSFNDHDLGEAAKRVYPANDSIGWSQVIQNAPDVDDIYDVIGWSQSIDTDGTDFGGDVAASFLQQHVSFRVDGPTCVEKEYTPFVGESGDDSFPEVSTDVPVLGEFTLRLTHPFTEPTLYLNLKNPDFGNADVLRFTKIDRTTRGGDRKIFSDLGWGSTQSFELTVSNICDTTATIDDLIDFLNTSLGEEIGLLDWENRQWRGIIVEPETTVTPQVGGHSIRLVFEGILVEEIIG